MKKILAFAVAAVAMSGSAFAATPTNTATATASGTVVVPVTITKTTDLNIGDLTRSQLKTIAPGSANGAEFEVIGDAGDLVSFTMPSTVNLVYGGAAVNTAHGILGTSVDGDQDHDMVVNLEGRIRYINDHNITGTAVIPAVNQLTSSTTPGSGPYGGPGDADGVGQMYVYVGGSVTPAADQQRGFYSGDFSVTVNYTN